MRATALLTALALSGCTAIVGDEIGDLETSSSSQQDIGIRLVAFDPHVGQLIDLQIVDPTENFIQARAIIDTLPSACLDLRMRRGAPVAANRLDFYADLDMDRTLDPPPTDHVWRCDDTAATACALDRGRLTFVHNVMFQDISATPAMPIGASLVVNVTGAESHDGESVTIQLLTDVPIDDTGTVLETTVPGLYFLSSVSAGDVQATLPGIVDSGRTYDLELTFGDNAEICTLADQRAPATGDFLVEAALAAFTCEPAPAVDCADLQTRCDDMGDQDACETLFRRCAIVDCAR